MTREPCQRIGHGGASALVPANTLASFEMAHELGVDMVEFDVRGCRGRLLLAHTISIGGRVARLSRRWNDWRAQVLAGLVARRWDALMAQHRLVEGRLLADVAERDGLLYAWTVNQRPVIDRLRRLGVHGIATADPRLFA